MPPFAFVFGLRSRHAGVSTPHPDPDFLPRYLLRRHLEGETIREIATELDLPDAEVQHAILSALDLPRR